MVKAATATGENIPIIDDVQIKVIKAGTSFGHTNCVMCEKDISYKNFPDDYTEKHLCADCMNKVYEMVKGSKQ